MAKYQKAWSVLRKTLVAVPCAYVFACLQMNDFVSSSTHKILNSVVGPEYCRRISVSYLKCIEYVFYTKKVTNTYLVVDLCQNRLKMPIGVAAGFDINGECVRGLKRVGFGFIEIGTVTPKPQHKNSNKKVKRNWSDGSLNYIPVSPNAGFDVVHDQLLSYRKNGGKSTIGVNIGQNDDSVDPLDEYVQGVKKFLDVADYVAFNVSTDQDAVKNHELNRSQLFTLIPKVKKIIGEATEVKKSCKVFLKLSPDLSDDECKEISRLILDPNTSVDAIILSNAKHVEGPKFEGRLSGNSLKEQAIKRIKLFYKLTNGTVPIVGCGGINNGQDAYEIFANGASAIQVLTSFTNGGYGTPKYIMSRLNFIILSKGHKSITDIIGINHKQSSIQ